MVEPIDIKDYEIDEEFVENCIMILPPSPELEAFPVELATNQKIGDVLLDDCICLICNNAVWKAKECGKCSKLFC